MTSAYTGYSSEVINRITREPVRRRKSRTKTRAASAVRFPTTTLTTNRLCGSRATWSQQSPQRASSGAQFFCFLRTNAHFSSNWTSTVRGGKRDPLVVELLGVVAGQPGVPGDRVLAHPGEPGGLAGPDPLGHVGQHVVDSLRWQSGVEVGRALALGEPGRAGAAPEHAARLVRPVPHGYGQVPVPALPHVGTRRVQTTERAQVVHDRPPLRKAIPYRTPKPPATITGHHLASRDTAMARRFEVPVFFANVFKPASENATDVRVRPLRCAQLGDAAS